MISYYVTLLYNSFGINLWLYLFIFIIFFAPIPFLFFLSIIILFLDTLTDDQIKQNQANTSKQKEEKRN